MMLLATWWHTEPWPTARDVGVEPVLGAVGVGLLVAASVAAWLARKTALAARRLQAKVGLVVALVCASLFVGLRGYEYCQFHHDGLWRRTTVGPIHERADIYYVQAVRFRLAELFRELDDRSMDHPNEFTDKDARRLELVTNLRTNMVNWTEHEVGHWLEDPQQRREVMALVAYQVHPLARNQAAVESSVRRQLRELERQRQWFDVLHDYCQEKWKLLNQKRQSSNPEVAETEASAAETTGATLANSAGTSVLKLLVDLDRELTEKIDAMGLTDWSYARSVIEDTPDLAMAGERLNQITARLDAMDARASFLDQVEQSVLKDPDTEGLNRKHRWLRLPVCLPGGNAWARGYFALTSLHLLLLGVAALLSLFVLLGRFGSARAASWRNVEWWWYASSLIGVALFLLFYVF